MLVATDDGVPPLSDEAQLIVRMTRNINPPVFVKNYSEVISEYADVGQHVVRVQALDADPINSPSGQITYHLLPGKTQGALQYFSIGRVNDPGLITVNKTIKEFPEDDMYFRVEARDGGDPAKTGLAYVHIKYVIRSVCVILIYSLCLSKEYISVQTC